VVIRVNSWLFFLMNPQIIIDEDVDGHFVARVRVLIFLITMSLLLTLAGCKSNSPTTASSEQQEYKCEDPEQPEPKTSKEYIERANDIIYSNKAQEDPHDCALNACSQAIARDPSDPEAYACRAERLRLKSEPEKALIDANETIRLSPNKPRGYRLRAAIYGNMKNWDLAVADMTKTIEVAGDDVFDYDYARRGDYYSEAGKYEEAVKDLTRAIKMSPDWLYHYIERAKVFEKMGKNDLAEADLIKSAELETGRTSHSGPGKTTSSILKARLRDSIYGGIMNRKALSIPAPMYPLAAKTGKAEGDVTVRITVDKNGTVTSADAVLGHRFLMGAAEQAALGAKFEPALVNGKAVKVNGFLVFNFILSDPRYIAKSIDRRTATSGSASLN
jgi:TonB family protein